MPYISLSICYPFSIICHNRNIIATLQLPRTPIITNLLPIAHIYKLPLIQKRHCLLFVMQNWPVPNKSCTGPVKLLNNILIHERRDGYHIVMNESASERILLSADMYILRIQKTRLELICSLKRKIITRNQNQPSITTPALFGLIFKKF